jgi:uncharacterized cupin superfamily protein
MMSMTRRSVFWAGMTVASSLSTHWTVATARQSAGPDIDVLIEATLSELPPPPAFLRLVRISLQPGAAVPTHRHPGPEFALVESGAVTVVADDELAIARAVGGEERGPSGSTVVLAAGDRVGFPAGVAFSLANAGDGLARLLTLVVLPVGPDRPAGAEVLATPETGDQGVRSQPLGDAVAPGWPAAPVALTVQRETLSAGVAVPAAGGPVMLAVERGFLSFALQTGEYEVSVAGGSPRPRSAVGVAERLEPGDAVFFPGGVNGLPRAADEGELVLLRVAVVSATQPEREATPAASASPAPLGRLGLGDRVLINEDGVRLRAAPSLAADVVDETPTGTAFVITGAPVAGNGLVWYPVASDDGDESGFIAEAFLDPDD